MNENNHRLNEFIEKFIDVPTLERLTFNHLDELASEIRKGILEIDPEAKFEIVNDGIKVTAKTRVLITLESCRPDLAETYRALSPTHRRYVWRMIAALPMLHKLEASRDLKDLKEGNQ